MPHAPVALVEPALVEAGRLSDVYRALPAAEQTAFAQRLATECALADQRAVAEARRILVARPASTRSARAALEPPYVCLLRRLRDVDGGAAVAVDLRARLRTLGGGDPAAAALEEELRDVLAVWFVPSSFDLRRVTWDAPASLLETLASLEAVHAVRSWDDLKNRLDADRRVYALFHPLLGDLPIAFTQIAVTRDLEESVDALLDESAPRADPVLADTATFYSISATQSGMSGLGVGALLIERAIDELREELPRLKTFATLSPLPGLVQWMRDTHSGAETERLLDAATRGDDAARKPLLRFAARYLLHGGDPVANFHLGNGARVERLNWQADRSAAGLRASAGVMVNYVYRLRERAQNRIRYLDEGSITASGAVVRLASAGG